jgi:hypothetical protein
MMATFRKVTPLWAEAMPGRAAAAALIPSSSSALHTPETMPDEVERFL